VEYLPNLFVRLGEEGLEWLRLRSGPQARPADVHDAVADRWPRGRHPILAVYDGSAASKHALAYAAGLARRTDRWLVIVRVWRSRRLTRAPMTVRVLRPSGCPAVVVP
jgi:hypothetical protein